MIDSGTLVVTDQYNEISQRWQKALELGDSVSVIFPYLNDRIFRIFQWTDGTKNSNLFPIYINLQTEGYDEYDDLEKFILSELPDEIKQETLTKSLSLWNKTIVLVITSGELLHEPRHERIKYILQKLLITYNQKITTFIGFESNISMLFPNVQEYNLLFQNIIYYPLYPDEDISNFVAYLCDKWSMKMPSPVRKAIIAASGGSFWLCKEACRIFRNQNAWNPEENSFVNRLKSLASSFSKEECTILCGLPSVKQHEKAAELTHLRNVGFISRDNKFRIPLLLPLIKDRLGQELTIKIHNGELEYKGVSLSQLLSPTEYELMRLFVSKPNEPVDRDRLAQAIWPNNTEDHYSPWAIDQAVKRLRDRLVSLRLPPTIISSVRGVGYEYRTA